ncbi:MAG TPA: YbjN domain-containing protein [Patescibacteria group bacterium]|nr:YbjN domain-containing protein [Patescibacteria group bacterium]
MGYITEAVTAFLTAEGWPVWSNGEGNSVRLQTGVRACNGGWLCRADIQEQEGLLIFNSVLECFAPLNRRALAAELLNRINSRLLLGHFCLDYTDGEISFRTSLDLSGTPLTAAMVSALIYRNVQVMDCYFPAIMGLLYGGLEPVQALSELVDEQAAGSFGMAN